MADPLFISSRGRFRSGEVWEITCRELPPTTGVQGRTESSRSLVAQIIRHERRQELQGLINYLYNFPPATHVFRLRRQTTAGWAVLHHSAINNTARYHHPSQQRLIYPPEIAQGIVDTWKFLLFDDAGKPHDSTKYFATPGEVAWMFWAGALVRSYYAFTEGGVARGK